MPKILTFRTAVVVEFVTDHGDQRWRPCGAVQIDGGAPIAELLGHNPGTLTVTTTRVFTIDGSDHALKRAVTVVVPESNIAGFQELPPRPALPASE